MFRFRSVEKKVAVQNFSLVSRMNSLRTSARTNLFFLIFNNFRMVGLFHKKCLECSNIIRSGEKKVAIQNFSFQGLIEKFYFVKRIYNVSIYSNPKKKVALQNFNFQD